MSHTKPLKELIAELQKIEDSKPGILCTINDSDWGTDSPKVQLSPVYTNTLGALTIFEDIEIHHINSTAQEYSTKRVQEMWNETDKESWSSFEEFEESYNLIKNQSSTDVNNLNKAVEMVIIHS